MTMTFKQYCFAVLLCGGCAFAGETVTPPNPVPDKPPISINPETPKLRPEIKNPSTTPPGTSAVIPNPEMYNLLMDMKDGDTAKRDAAGKVLATKGPAAYRSLTQFLNSPDADLVKRVKAIRAEIEGQAKKLFDTAQTLQDKALSGPFTVAAFDEARKAWVAAAQSTPQRELQQNAVKGMQQMQQMMAQVEQWQKIVTDKDAELAAKPAPGQQVRASIQLTRAQSLNDLQRFDEALIASQDAFNAAGKEGRYAPAALRMTAEMLNRKADTAGVENACKKLIADYSDSLEARFAYGSLAEMYTEAKRWDEAVDAVKKFNAACPLEEDAQSALDNLLDTLMEKERDYPRAYGLSMWIKQHMPISRVRPEVLKDLAQCSEYAMHDLPKAETAYKALEKDYGDVVNATEVEAILKRVKAKIDHTFPKEPKAGDEGPAGALGQYITAVRSRDAKSLKAIVPETEANEEVGKLTCETCELVRIVTCGDYVIKKVVVDGDKATLTIDYYDAVSDTPHDIVQKAVNEKGAWKIVWTDPEAQLNPPTAPKLPAK